MRVHRNLNRGTWSLTEPGRAVRHAEAAALAGVSFKVSAAGRARVLARRVRAVHAWAVGTPAPTWPKAGAPLVAVTYNPFRAGTFTRCDTGEPVYFAAFVYFAADGACLAQLEG